MTSILEKLRESLTTRAELSQSLKAASKVQSKRLQSTDLFRPQPYQDEFFCNPASEFLVRGGNRTGKTLVCAVGMAAYLLDREVETSIGLKVRMREEQFRDKPVGECWCIGKNTNHAATFYRVLFQPGLFKILRDKTTGRWRAWQPGVIPGDEDVPETELKPSPPLIYPGDCKFGWESMKEKKWTSCELPNGWVLKFYASSGDVKRGDPVHRLWIDEDIEIDSHYDEWQARLSDFKGRIWWSSWPQISCGALMKLYRRSETQMEEVRRGVRKVADAYNVQWKSDYNKAVDEGEKLKRMEGWDEVAGRIRGLGEFVTDTIQTYPEFDRVIHSVDYGEGHPLNDKLREVLKSRNWRPPEDWTVELILDPGTGHPGVLWGSIPPEEFWDEKEPYFVVYQEMAIPRISAEGIAARVVSSDPARRYNRWIIDKKAGDQTPMGATWQVQGNYARAFREQGLRNDLMLDMFFQGDPNWITRSTALRRWMRGRKCGRPQLRIVTHMCPELIRQLESNVRAVNKDDVQDRPAKGQKQDIMDCLEYWAGADPQYVFSRGPDRQETPGFKAWMNEPKMWEGLVGTKQAPAKPVMCGIP